MRRIFYLISVFIFSIASLSAKAQTGVYKVTGYIFDIGNNNRPINTFKEITSASNGKLLASAAGDYSNSVKFSFRIDSANHLADWAGISSNPFDTTGSFVYQDNPPGSVVYPGETTGFLSSTYNNTYDSLPDTFFMHYGFHDNGSGLPDPYVTQVYEKWEQAVQPVIQSFSPTRGLPGDIVTIKGIGFTYTSVVFFNGVPADSFTVVSDSVIRAVAPYSSTGDIYVISQIGSSSKGTFIYTLINSDNSNWDTAGNAYFADTYSGNIGLATDTGGHPYVVFTQKGNGAKAAVMRLGDDNTWHPVGDAVSENTALTSSLVIGTDNVPYVAFIDSFHNGVVVKKFVNGQWQYIGNPNMDTLYWSGYSYKISMALDKNNTPYLLTTNFRYGYLYVFKLVNNSWQRVGQVADHELVSASYNGRLAVDTLENVYVFYDEKGNHDAIIERFDGSRWDTLGTPGFTHSSNGIYYPDIKITKSGQPIISMQDDNGPENASVFQYDSSAWQPYGIQYFSPEHVYNVSLALSPLDKPYVFFQDATAGGYGTVMTPVGNGDSNWQYVGQRAFVSDKYISQNTMAVSNKGVVYVAYSDERDGYKLLVMSNSTYQNMAPRTIPGLYTQGDSAACMPWVREYPNWTSYTSTDSSGTHIEMQTQFQDDPGSICGYEGYIDSSIKEAMIGNDSVILFPRNYRISFSQSPFAHQVGIRLFATTGEVNQWLSAVNADDQITHAASDVVLYQYDGPNEDYRLDNNSPTSAGTDTLVLSNYKHINPTVHYYGSANEYCYFEFYTNHFSEFHLGIPVFGLLPLNLLSFTAKPQSQTALLNWQTSTEINSSFFTVQRSTDGIHFTNIGKVSATNTGSNHIYNYQDDLSTMTATTVYYRLQIVDKDGSSKESGIVSVTLSGDKKIVIVPNPAHTYFTVTGNLATKNTLLITDMSGKIALVKDNITSNEKISISALSKGIYLVKMDDGKTVTVKKLIVE